MIGLTGATDAGGVAIQDRASSAAGGFARQNYDEFGLDNTGVVRASDSSFSPEDYPG